MASKKMVAAIRTLEDKLARNPRSRAFSRLADCYRTAGDLQRAIDLCLSGLDVHPDYVTGRLVLGRCYAQRKDYEAAAAELTRVCSIDRRNHAAMKLLADVFMKIDRADAAGRIYAILRDMEPDNGAIRQLAIKHRSALHGGICDILGIKNDAGSLFGSLPASAGGDPAADMQNLDTIISTPTGSFAPPPGFGAPPAPPAPSPVPVAPGMGEPSGEDVSNQLDSIFGGDAPEPTPDMPMPPPLADMGMADAAAPEMSTLTGEDVTSQLDAMFGTGAQEQSPDMSLPPPLADMGMADAAAPEMSTLTGEDVTNQLDAMFGTGAVDTLAMPLPAEPLPAADMGMADMGMTDMGAVGTEAPALSGDDIASTLDTIYGLQAPTMDMGAGVIDTETGDIMPQEQSVPAGADIENTLDAIYGAAAAPSLDIGMADDMAVMDEAITTIESDMNPTGSDVADQLDAMFGIQEEQTESAVALGIETGIITTIGEDVKPTGSDVADQLDAMFGLGDIPPAPVDIDTQSSVEDALAQLATDTNDDLTGSDIADQLDAMFGLNDLPPAPTDIDTQSTVEDALAQMGADDDLTGSDVANQLDAMFGLGDLPPAPTDIDTQSTVEDALAQMGTPPLVDDADVIGTGTDELNAGSAAEATVGESGDTPVNLFDYGAEETLQIDSGDLAAAMTAEAANNASALFDFGAVDTAVDTVMADQSAIDGQDDGLLDIAPAAAAPEQESVTATDGVSALKDTNSFKQNVPDPEAIEDGVGTISFTPNVPAANTEIVHGEDIEQRLSELFSGDGGDASAALQDVVGEASAADMAQTMPMTADEIGGAVGLLTGEELHSSDDIDSALEDAIAQMSGIAEDIPDATAQELDGIGDTLEDIEDSKQADDLSVLDGIDELEDHLREILNEDIGVEINPDIGNKTLSLGGEPSDTAADIASDPIDNITADISAHNIAGDMATDTLADNAMADVSQDISVDNLSADIVSDISSDITPDIVTDNIAEDMATDTLADNAMVDVSQDISVDDLSADIASDISSDITPDIVTDNIAADITPDVVTDTAADTSADTADRPDAAYYVSEDDVQERIRQLFKEESSEVDTIDVGADMGIDSALDERDTPFDLPDHVLTPTLADIYFQQGQPKLALHIYERLAARDPDDARLREQIQSIKDALLQTGDASYESQPTQRAAAKPTEKKATAGRKKKGADIGDERKPLAGVRIGKKSKTAAKTKRKA